MSEGEELIFIACQPRSGSTLLQKVLGAHSLIHTVSEPWLMLPPAYTLKREGVSAEYDANLASTGIQTFWETLPEGRGDYIEGIRRMYQFLYQRALETTQASLFLDKTPRYYLILPELKEIFPEARFIFLIRNPLAVLSSILRTWVKGKWLKLAKHRSDLLRAPTLLLEATSEFGSRAETIRYEELVCDPESETAALCEHLNVEAESGMVEYREEGEEEWTLGDPNSVHEHSRPQTSSLEKWSHPDDAQQWRLLNDYINALGEDTFESLGYDFEECLEKLEVVRPERERLKYTVSLKWLLNNQGSAPNRWRHHRVQILDAVREGGVKSVAQYAAGRIKNRLF